MYDERGDQKSITVVHALGFEDVLRDSLVGAFWLHLVFFFAVEAVRSQYCSQECTCPTSLSSLHNFVITLTP